MVPVPKAAYSNQGQRQLCEYYGGPDLGNKKCIMRELRDSDLLSRMWLMRDKGAWSGKITLYVETRQSLTAENGKYTQTHVSHTQTLVSHTQTHVSHTQTHVSHTQTHVSHNQTHVSHTQTHVSHT